MEKTFTMTKELAKKFKIMTEISVETTFENGKVLELDYELDVLECGTSLQVEVMTYYKGGWIEELSTVWLIGDVIDYDTYSWLREAVEVLECLEK